MMQKQHHLGFFKTVQSLQRMSLTGTTETFLKAVQRDVRVISQLMRVGEGRKKYGPVSRKWKRWS